jgi:signal transduction histidine kinase
MSIGLGVQLLLSHVVAAGAAVAVTGAIAGPGGVALALVAAAVAGLAVTFTVQRTLWLVNAALARLNGSRPPAELPAHWHGPLAGLVGRINALMAREREVHDLREGLLAQARDGAAQQERNRLARELHDSIKQQIFSIGMGAAAAQARWDADPQGAREALGDVRRSAQEAMVEMNVLLQQLSPAPLEKVGLVQALRDQCDALGYRTDAQVAVEFGALPADDWLPTGAQESMFRVAQEAFSNIARHARADHVRLYMGQRDADGPLTLEIQDDGRGFEVGRCDGGMGLENIRQRVVALGGELAVDSAPGKGTTLRVTVPVLEPMGSEEETMQGQNHTLNKVFLVGLAGGLALIGTLFYPLYVLLPGRTIGGWPTGWGIVGLALEIVAALLAVATGFLAARWVKANTRRGGALFGALAGAVAGAVLFFAIGAPAASVTGAARLLERGLVPAAGRADVVRLLAESTVGIVWWSHGAFWAALLAGTGLGAVGGLLAQPAAAPSRRTGLRLTARAILTAAAIVSALSFLAAVTGFGLLEPTIRDGLAANGVTLGTGLPLETISDWLIGTPLVLYIVSLVALYFLVRAEIRTADEPARLGAARATAQFLGLVSLGVPVYLAAMGSPALPKGGTVVPRGWMDVTGLFHPSPASPGGAIGPLLLSLGLGGSLLLGGLYLAAMREAYRRQRARGLFPPHPVQSMAVVGILLSPGIIDWAIGLSTAHSPVSQFVGVLVGLAMVVVDVALIVGLLRAPRQSLSYTITLAQMRSALSQLIRGGLGAVVAMVVPPMTVFTTQVGLGLITNQLVEVLVGREFAAQEFTLAELVRDVYLAQASALLTAFVAATAVIGLLTLIISGIMALPAQLVAQNAEAAH